MSIGSIYSLNDAQRLTGATRNLITYLIRDRQIPVKHVGMAKVIDDDGLNRLRAAIEDYQQKPDCAAATA